MRRVLFLSLLAGLALPQLDCRRPPGPSQGHVTAAAFDLPDLAGGRLTLDALKGKVVVLDFWATWCGPCLIEMPHYAEFWNKNRSRGVEVVGVVFDSGGPQEIQDFVREKKIAYRQVLGNDEMLGAYGAQLGFPTTFVLDQKGQIRLKIEGASPNKFERLQKAVDEALAGTGAVRGD